MATPDPDRREALLTARARAVVADQSGCASDALGPTILPGGVAVAVGDRGWFFVDDAPRRALGAALLWSWRSELANLVIVVDDPDHAREVAEAAPAFRIAPEVRRLVGRTLSPVELRTPSPRHAVPEVPRPVADAIHAAGADLVVEHGVIRAEVEGLEVGQGETVAGEVVLRSGIGRFDRETSAMLHGDQPPGVTLRAAVDLVRRHRRPGAPHHPLGTLARERWLRKKVLESPTVLGLSRLEPIDPAYERPNLRDPSPAPALSSDDERVLVVCSVGFDLELPASVGVLVRREQPRRVVVVLPAGDAVPTMRGVLSWIDPSLSLVEVDPPWKNP